MTNLRDRARELRDAGEAARSVRHPEEGTLPVRMYNYWVEHSLFEAPVQENFCHYTRVVVFWAPLTWVRVHLERMYSHAAAWLVTGVAYVALMVVLGVLVDPITFIGVLIGIPWLTAGLAFGGTFTPRTLPADRFIRAGWYLTLPVSGTFYLARRGFGSIPRRVWDALGRVGLGLVVLTLAGSVVTLFVAIYLSEGWTGLAIVLGVLIGCGLVVGMFVLLAVHYEKKHERQRRERRERIMNMTHEELTEFLRPPTRKPSRLSKFFSDVGGLVVFVVQFIRVKKLRICPFVNVPLNRSSNTENQ